MASSTHIIAVGQLGQGVLTSGHDGGDGLRDVSSGRVSRQAADGVGDVASE